MTTGRLLLILVAFGLGLIGWAYWTAIADPVVREARIGLADWPPGSPPLRAVLISDIHVAGPDMPPARLARIDLAATLAAMRRLDGARIVLSHSPDPFAEFPAEAGLIMLAGHTHCGQVRLPFVGALSTMSEHGERYACGLVRERGNMLIVTAGLGTSILPLRLGAAPDLWLVTLGPARR